MRRVARHGLRGSASPWARFRHPSNLARMSSPTSAGHPPAAQQAAQQDALPAAPVAAISGLLQPLVAALRRVARVPARELLLLVAAVALLRSMVAPAGAILFRAALDAAGLATLTDRDLGR